ncbi:Dyp-type peroxidase [Streptomyces sp. NBC_01794]|uniref:Dyp-type peroxidase n=1 Tax=Streptomyces sp. NBC_01794 TaxID=2975942 RepID=UPI003090CD49|nr:Dyp-type peroxidase [Streptomyces sp. NBC_01794]
MKRRSLLLGATLAVPVGAVAVVAVSGASDEETLRDVPELLRNSLPQPHQVLVALDLRPGINSPSLAARELSRVLRQNRRDGTRMGIGLGHGLFADASRRPRQLTMMPSFAGDVLNPAESHGDALIQIAGSTHQEVQAARKDVVAALTAWQARWQIVGFRAENRTEYGKPLAMNPFHFQEGFGNTSGDRGIADRALVRADQNEPAWAVGGSYQVVRIIRLATELWDKDPVHEQERIIGRRRDGRWLDGTPTGDEPNFAADPAGRLTPLDSHVRRAAPDRRNPPPIVRRGYSYDRRHGDRGLIFSCFQRDLAAGFETVQKRLAGEAMAKYQLTTGGGYFFVPPPGDAWIEALFPA